MRPEPLSDLLEEERRLLLSGDWRALEEIAPRKAAHLAVLEDGDPAGLAPLARDLARNQALLAAAIEGLREAGRRRAALGAARAGLVTYDAQGARAELPLAPPRVERRA
jgi:hypothetical protein